LNTIEDHGDAREIHEPDTSARMACFDALPREWREALASARFNWCPTAIASLLSNPHVGDSLRLSDFDRFDAERWAASVRRAL
jgi:hypothetical protein